MHDIAKCLTQKIGDFSEKLANWRNLQANWKMLCANCICQKLILLSIILRIMQVANEGFAFVPGIS
jgi:hypothetical protein